MKNQREVILKFLLLIAFVAMVQILPAQEQGSRKAVARVQPEYSELARRMHLAGKVKLQVKVAATGAVKEAQIVGGHPVLAASAQEAVRKWKFETGAESTEIVVFTFTGAE